MTTRMGYWIDLEAAYVTCENEYIESVWWALSELFKKGLIYKDYKIVPNVQDLKLCYLHMNQRLDIKTQKIHQFML